MRAKISKDPPPKEVNANINEIREQCDKTFYESIIKNLEEKLKEKEASLKSSQDRLKQLEHQIEESLSNTVAKEKSNNYHL